MRERKLTDQDEKLIRRLVRFRKSLSNERLAQRFGVCPALISYIGSGKDFRLRWKTKRAGVEFDI